MKLPLLAVGRCCRYVVAVTLLPLGFVERGLLLVEEVNVAVEVYDAVEVAVACCWTLLMLDVVAVTLLPLGFVERGLVSVEEVNVAVIELNWKLFDLID